MNTVRLSDEQQRYPYLVLYTDAETNQELPWGFCPTSDGGAVLKLAKLCPWAKRPRVVPAPGHAA